MGFSVFSHSISIILLVSSLSIFPLSLSHGFSWFLSFGFSNSPGFPSIGFLSFSNFPGYLVFSFPSCFLCSLLQFTVRSTKSLTFSIGCSLSVLNFPWLSLAIPLFSRSRTTSQIQGARAGGLDLKDLLLLPSSHPSLPQLNVLITLGKRENNRFTDPPLLLCVSLFALDPGTRKQGRDWMGKFGFRKEATECARKNAIIFMACL